MGSNIDSVGMTIASLSNRDEQTKVLAPSATVPEVGQLAPAVAFATGLLLAIAMPLVVPQRLMIWADKLAAQPNGWLLSPIAWLMVGISVITGVRWTVLISLSYLGYRQSERDGADPETWPLVSVLVPAYNEGETIAQALRSLIDLDYPCYEVIVVDDGSSDETYERAKPFEGRHGGCQIRVFRKPNGGKWSTHNFGFARSRGELLLCVDADSGLEPQSLRLLVRRMDDPEVSAVSGQIRARNRINAITWLQGLEYLMANGSLRMAQGHSGTVLVVPGPIGLFRRSAMEEVYLRWGRLEHTLQPGEVEGPLSGDTFAEDFDLSAAVVSLGGRIVYEHRAISHTKVPDWVFPLINQRYRWSRGTIQVLRKYWRRAQQDPQLRRGRLIGWMLGTYALDLVLMPISYLAAIALTGTYLVSGGNIPELMIAISPMWLLNLNLCLFYAVTHRDRLSVVRAMPLYDVYQGLLLSCGWLIAIADEIRDAKMRW